MAQEVPGAGDLDRPAQPQGRGTALRVAGSFLQLRWASILVVAIALGAYFAFSNSAFLTDSNLLVIASFLSATAIICAGEVMLMICGEIDLSVGFVFALSPFVMYFTWNEFGLPLWLGIVAGLLVGAAVGLVNGLVTVVLRVPSFIT